MYSRPWNFLSKSLFNDNKINSTPHLFSLPKLQKKFIKNIWNRIRATNIKTITMKIFPKTQNKKPTFLEKKGATNRIKPIAYNCIKYLKSISIIKLIHIYSQIVTNNIAKYL